MGCFWSDQNQERCRHCNRKAVNNLIIVNESCQICIDREQRGQSFRNPTRRAQLTKAGPPYFGEYKCKKCGRFWNSRLCWPNSYQMCKTCRKPVYAFNFRSISSSDMTYTEDKEHAKDLCQKCKELGCYCGNRRMNNNKKFRKRY